MKRLLLLPFLALPLAACGGDSPEAEAPAPPEATDVTPVPARMEDGVQVAEITVGPRGYSPSHIALEAGVPARLVFTRTVEGACAEQVQSPALGIAKTPLPLNEPHAIEFTPPASGTFGFTCGMEMMEGAVIVGT
jgi:plastocyanin domain-containing protein